MIAPDASYESTATSPSRPSHGLVKPRRRYYRVDPRTPERLVPAVGKGSSPSADLKAATIHGAFRGFVLNHDYPCVGAKSAVRTGSYRIGLYRRLGGRRSTATLAEDLRHFVGHLGEVGGPFATFIATFQNPRVSDEPAFETGLWRTLRHLQGEDVAAWDPSVSDDPRDPHFSFSFAGSAFFVVGLHARASRQARRFPWPTLIFNPHAQFERLRTDGRWDRMRQSIRDQDVALQGSINPVLRDFGDSSEARQYSGRQTGPDWHAPFTPGTDRRSVRRCPFARLAGLWRGRSGGGHDEAGGAGARS